MTQNNASPQSAPTVAPRLDQRILRGLTGAKGGQRKTMAAQKREELRESLWPGAANLIWSRHTNDGYTTIPRLLSLVMHLVKRLSLKGDPSVVYFDLWTRAYDEGMVTIFDEGACAFSSGYSGTRALRTWREHVLKLAELGFIRIKPEGNREIAHVLLLDPLKVCVELHRDKPREVTEEWWVAFVRRANEIKAKIPILEKQD